MAETNQDPHEIVAELMEADKAPMRDYTENTTLPSATDDAKDDGDDDTDDDTDDDDSFAVNPQPYIPPTQSPIPNVPPHNEEVQPIIGNTTNPPDYGSKERFKGLGGLGGNLDLDRVEKKADDFLGNLDYDDDSSSPTKAWSLTLSDFCTPESITKMFEDARIYVYEELVIDQKIQKTRDILQKFNILEIKQPLNTEQQEAKRKMLALLEYLTATKSEILAKIAVTEGRRKVLLKVSEGFLVSKGKVGEKIPLWAWALFAVFVLEFISIYKVRKWIQKS